MVFAFPTGTESYYYYWTCFCYDLLLLAGSLLGPGQVVEGDLTLGFGHCAGGTYCDDGYLGRDADVLIAGQI
jgi:hypothetical protein